MKTCSKCGKELLEEVVVCPECGCSTAQQNAVTTHDIPKCTCCGHIGEMKPGPLLRNSDIIWIILLFVTMFGGFVYLAYVLITRLDPNKREKICSNCKSVNMYTYVY